MLTMQGKLMAVIRREPGERNGEKYDGYVQVQLLTEDELADGQVKHALHTLSMDLDHHGKFDNIDSGAVIRVPVRAYTRGNVVAFTTAGDPSPEVVRGLSGAKALVDS